MSDQHRWWTEGKCFGDPIEEWMPSSLPSSEPTRSIMAQAKCSGCPVFRECGMDVLRNRDMDVIRAGQALDSTMGPRLREQYALIREQLGMFSTEKPEEWPRRCRTCRRNMRPRGETYADWPHTVASHNKNECNTCHNKRWRSNGPVGPPPRGERAPVRGAGAGEAGGA